jgi:spore maturation protein CgeB
MAPMRVLYVAMRHDYGDPRRGLSFEETNFRSSLEGMGHDVVAFDFMDRARRDGVERMRRDLVAVAADSSPDLAFFFLFTDQLDSATIEAVGREGHCPTVNWFADDHWRFDDFSRHVAPAFDLAVTTDPESVPKYEQLDGVRVQLSQWACNRYAYRRTTTELRHGVTFVGQPHGDRRRIIKRLEQAGHPVECWGHGWRAGRLEHDAMVDVFSSSAINLNLSNSSDPRGIKRLALWLLRRGGTGPRRPQIKGRNFEVPGCGGFLLTEKLPYLDRYFSYDAEIGIYDGEDELVEKVGYWLEHPDERAAVAEAGYRRVLAEHTYDHRFGEIFAALGLETGSAAGRVGTT